MKLDFLTGHGGGGSSPAMRFFTPRHDPVPPRALDDAGGVIRVGLVAAGLFFGVLGVFSVIAPISGAAVASGEVTTNGNRLVIQPEAGGLVSDLLVFEGQSVRAGQPLVRLNGVRSTAAAEQAQARRDALRALQARLVAERDGLDAIRFPPDLAQRAGNAAAASAMAAQQAIFGRRQEVLRADRAIADEQRSAVAAQRLAAARQLALIQDELAGIRRLYARGYARKTQVRALERAAAQLQGEASAGGAGVAEAKLRSARLANDQMLQIVAELGRVEEQLAQVDPALRVTRYDESRDLLRAPVNGRVAGVARLGPGAVLRAGQTVMEVVPAGRTLIVEARVRPEDVDDVRVGAPATLRFTTVNPRGRSSFDGKVVTLSPTRIADEDGQPGYFRAQVAITDPAMLTREGVRLQPGLPVAVNITTHDRTMFDYLFAPVGDALSGGFREE